MGEEAAHRAFMLDTAPKVATERRSLLHRHCMGLLQRDSMQRPQRLFARKTTVSPTPCADLPLWVVVAEEEEEEGEELREKAGCQRATWGDRLLPWRLHQVPQASTLRLGGTRKRHACSPAQSLYR